MSDLQPGSTMPDKTQDPSPPAPPSASSSNLDAVAFQAAGLSVQDVDAYLNDPQHKSLLSSAAKNSKPGTKTVIARLGTEPMQEPVQLGSPQTSHHVVALNHLCQERGLVPEYEIEGDSKTGFGGWLRVGQEIVGTDGHWRSKKSAKEALATKGVELVKAMQTKASPGAQGKNWIGLLLEYHTTRGHAVDQEGPSYTEYSIGSNFSCTCTIPSHDATFGSKTLAFPNKKAARANAAKEAVEYLIAAGLTNEDGSVKKGKTPKAGPSVEIEGKVLGVSRDASYAQKVSDICPILGLVAPTYNLTASSANAPNLLSGAAYFNNDPQFEGPIGEVRNVFGKKNAKEECARGVWEVLKKLARERGVEIEVSGEDEDMEL